MNPLRIAALAACTLLAGGLHAQTVYKIVGPDGKVTFSDRAPENAKATPISVGGAPAPLDTTALPSSVRNAVQQFPVTLYTSSDCTPCNSARNLLINRGVPFTERTIVSSADLDALKRLSGDTNLPFGTIGKQALKGFSDSDWTGYLDAAGYPKQSQLPASYHRPAATPLVAAPAAQAATQPKADEAPARRVPRPQAPAAGTNNPSNPAGIIF